MMIEPTQDQIDTILASNDSNADIGRALGLHHKTVAKVRKGTGGDNVVTFAPKMPEYSVEQIAKAAEAGHTAAQRYSVALSDNSDPNWRAASQWRKYDAIMRVEYLVSSPNPSEADRHEAWLKPMEMGNWSYGSAINEDIKRHPCFTSFAKLTLEQKTRATIFRKAAMDALNGVVEPGKAPVGTKVSDGPTTGYRDGPDGVVERAPFINGYLPDGWHDSPAKCDNCDGTSHPVYVDVRVV